MEETKKEGKEGIHSLLNTDDHECGIQRYWYIFFSSTLATFFGGLVVILLFRFISQVLNFLVKKIRSFPSWRGKKKYKPRYLYYREKRRKLFFRSGICFTYIKDFCGELISGKIKIFA